MCLALLALDQVPGVPSARTAALELRAMADDPPAAAAASAISCDMML